MTLEYFRLRLVGRTITDVRGYDGICEPDMHSDNAISMVDIILDDGTVIRSEPTHDGAEFLIRWQG